MFNCKLIVIVSCFILVSGFSSNVRECYIANRGTALVIGSTEIVPTLPSHDDVDGGNNQAYSSSHVNELNRQTDIEHEQCQTKCDISNNSGSEITHHLESMFNLLRPKETLKMVSIILFGIHLLLAMENN